MPPARQMTDATLGPNSGSASEPEAIARSLGASEGGKATGQASESRERPVAIDLCCGLGGLSEGLRMAGFDVRLGLDYSASAVVTYQQNNPGSLVALQDLSQLRKFKSYLAAVGIAPGHLDVLAGGTPCQSFSAANSRKRPGRNEHHNLVLEFARLVSESHPSAFVLENVPRMASTDGGSLLNEFLSRMEGSGYQVVHQVLCAADYGVPQTRRRLFIVGSRVGRFQFMRPTHGPESFLGKPHVTVRDAILGDLPPPVRRARVDSPMVYTGAPTTWYQRWSRVGSKAVTDHSWNDLGDIPIRRFEMIPAGLSWDQVQRSTSVPEDLRIRIEHRSVYRRLDPDKPAFTVVHPRKAMIVHPTQNRLLTIREAARLQSFRDRFVFARFGGKVLQYDEIQQQLANAVPPLLARAVARRLVSRLER